MLAILVYSKFSSDFIHRPGGQKPNASDFTCKGISLPGVPDALVLKLQSYGGMMYVPCP